MNTNKIQNTLKNFSFGFFLLFAFFLLSSTDVLAQRGRGSKEARKEYKREIKAERKEYKREIKAERREDKEQRKQERWNDRRDDNRYDDDRYDDERYDDDDYESDNRNDYRRNRGDLNRVAEQNGYNDGLREGAEDARSNDRYNPQGTSEYRRATNGYDYRYGNQGTYTQAYRQSFLRGYREGYDRYSRGY